LQLNVVCPRYRSFLASLILNVTKAEIDPCEFLAPEELVAQLHQALLLDS
jgi:hypothetical protein